MSSRPPGRGCRPLVPQPPPPRLPVLLARALLTPALLARALLTPALLARALLTPALLARALLTPALLVLALTAPAAASTDVPTTITAPAPNIAASAAPAANESIVEERSGWTMNQMAEAYGDTSFRRSSPKWPVLRMLPMDTGDGSSVRTLGGLSQYYGAGGFAPIKLEGGVVAAEENAAYPGWRPADGADVALRSFQLEGNQLLNHVTSTLWASVILRDNMVTVFGYIINRPNNTLSTDQYTALNHIYNIIRYRRMPTPELARHLKRISVASPTQQFRILFEEMKDVGPPYLRSACEFLVESIDKDELSVDEILRPDGGPLVVDFLEGIEPSVFKLLLSRAKFSKEAVDLMDSDKVEMLGPLLAYTWSSVTAGDFPLSQTLFALVLQHHPSNDMTPESLETERFLVDELRRGAVVGWDAIEEKSEVAREAGPYAHARAVLAAIAESPAQERPLRDAARTVLTHFKDPVATFSNPHYARTSPVVSKPVIDVVNILKAVTKHEYPEDVVDAKDRLTYYITSGFLDMEFVVRGFNRFDHSKTINLVIAILTRIEYRLPNLPEEIMSSVKYLKVALIFKKFVCSLTPVIPTDFLRSPFLLDSFAGPSMPKKIRSLVSKLEGRLRNVELPVQKLVDMTPVKECVRPRQCLLNLFRKIMKMNVIEDKKTNGLIMQLVKSLNTLGEPLEPVARPEQGNIYPRRKRKPCRKKNPFVNLDMKAKPIPEQTTKRPTAPLASFDDTLSALDDDTLDEDDDDDDGKTDIYPGAVDFPILFPILGRKEADMKPDYANPESLLPRTEIGTPEDTKIRPIREFLSQPDLYQQLGNFNPKDYHTKLNLLMAILRKSSPLKSVEYDIVLKNTIKDYLAFLENLPRLPDLIYQSVFPRISDKWMNEPTDFVEPVKNLPNSRSGTLEYDKMQPIRKLFSCEKLYFRVGPQFKPKKYKTKGLYVKQLLKHALRRKAIREASVLCMTIVQFLEYLDDAEIPLSEVRSTPFPPRDPLRDMEPPNPKLASLLLPVTIPGSAVHVKMRPLKELFRRPDFWKLLGSDFHPEYYVTKGDLLKAVLGHLLTLEVVKENKKLYQLTQEYMVFVQTESAKQSSMAISMNMNSLLNALPPPETSTEEQYLKQLKAMMQKRVVADDQELKEAKTRGEAMKLLLEKAMAEQDTGEAEPATSQAIEYFKDRVATEGYGAQPVEYVVHGTEEVEEPFDVFNLFRALDHDALDNEGRAAVQRVMKFVSNGFDPRIHLAGFDPDRFETKGDFLLAAFRHMEASATVDPRIKLDMALLENYVIHWGPGAEPVDAQAPEVFD